MESLPAWGMTVAGELFQLPTPSGLMALRASITSESAFGLSERGPTPTKSDADGGVGHPDTKQGGLNLRTYVARVPTPRKIDGRSATENTTDGALIRRLEKEGGTNLAEFVLMENRGLIPRLPTLTCQDAANNGAPSQMVRNSKPLNAVVGGPLNPDWAEWLMGWPIGWTDLLAPATDKYRQWCASHGISSAPKTNR